MFIVYNNLRERSAKIHKIDCVCYTQRRIEKENHENGCWEKFNTFDDVMKFITENNYLNIEDCLCKYCNPF